jgi:hypothetical protein
MREHGKGILNAIVAMGIEEGPVLFQMTAKVSDSASVT